jgi:uncharacterized protein YciI
LSFLVVLRPARPGIESEHELLEAHWEYLRRRHAEGKLHAMHAEIRPPRIVTR